MRHKIFAISVNKYFYLKGWNDTSCMRAIINGHEQIIVTRAVKDDVDLMSCETRMIFGSLGIAKELGLWYILGEICLLWCSCNFLRLPLDDRVFGLFSHPFPKRWQVDKHSSLSWGNSCFSQHIHIAEWWRWFLTLCWPGSLLYYISSSVQFQIQITMLVVVGWVHANSFPSQTINCLLRQESRRASFLN